MAIDSIPYADTDTLAQPGKAFYPLKIPVSHWQLRNYISHPEKDVLYYASGQDIYYLNSATRKRKQIATLPFEARCTASGYGYICVGGEEDGHFAVIKLEGRSVDVDAPLPLDYWQYHRSTPRAAEIKVERIGEEIVNSISIHQIRDEEAHLYDVVAVLTNNDKTVRVYSLTQRMETAVLDFPFPMNHATLSPDGLLLAAVGDVNRAFFYTRVLQREPPQIPKPHNRLNMCSVDWKSVCEIKLHVPSEPETNTGYFTTAWSSSGHLLAVGSEAGFITVFDVLPLSQTGPGTAEVNILATISSSRPNISTNMHPGAVRSMLFAPEPWDLLIWAEDQGRVCVGDLRTGLRTKQVVELDLKAEGLSKLDLDDLPSEDDSQHGRRLLQWADDFTRRGAYNMDDIVNLTVEPVETQIRQRHRRHNRSGIWTPPPPFLRESSTANDGPLGLTAHEQQILESLRTSRQREEARAQGSVPRSVNYTSGTMFRSTPAAPPGTTSRDASRSISDLLTANPDADAFPELSRSSQRAATSTHEDDSLPPLHAIQEYLTLRDQRANARQGGDDQDAHSSSAANRLGRMLSPPTQSSGPVPPHALRATLPSNSTPPNEDDTPWRTISNAMSLARGPLFESASDSPQDNEGDRNRDRIRMLGTQRDRLRELQRHYEAGGSAVPGSISDGPTQGSSGTRQYEMLHDPSVRTAVRTPQDYDLFRRRAARSMMGASPMTGREIGVRTAGLSMSRDGSTVWAATEEGIFEIKMALKQRMYWPAIEMQ